MNGEDIMTIRETVALMLLPCLPVMAGAQMARVIPAEDMEWAADPRLPGVKSFLLWGDPDSGEDHAMLRIFPAGFAPARHGHPSTERVVVISGRIIVEYDGGDETILGPGSYSEIPANTRHAVRCASDEDCKFVLSAPGIFTIDFDE
jgi:quercetin dioxygenase-like cupin family protein